MMFLIVSVATLVILVVVGVAVFGYKKNLLVREDNIAITVNRDGFIKRVLPAGRHVLYPFEKVDFTLETRSKVVSNQAIAITTSDGIPININWSGSYTMNPDLISERVSQRLRNLPNVEKPIARNTDIFLRKLVGDYTVPDLFKPTTRERIERQMSELLADRLKPLGIVFNGLSLQAINLPSEIAEALNRAKAIETLDRVIRQVDPATREVVRSAYQLDEILRWESYLPTPSRLAMKRRETVAH